MADSMPQVASPQAAPLGQPRLVIAWGLVEGEVESDALCIAPLGPPSPPSTLAPVRRLVTTAAGVGSSEDEDDEDGIEVGGGLHPRRPGPVLCSILTSFHEELKPRSSSELRRLARRRADRVAEEVATARTAEDASGGTTFKVAEDGSEQDDDDDDNDDVAEPSGTEPDASRPERPRRHAGQLRLRRRKPPAATSEVAVRGMPAIGQQEEESSSGEDPVGSHPPGAPIIGSVAWLLFCTAFSTPKRLPQRGKRRVGRVATSPGLQTKAGSRSAVAAAPQGSSSDEIENVQESSEAVAVRLQPRSRFLGRHDGSALVS
mmetsp:Transcript_144824/g.464194  ORF Transcript_144824/g.464194 Transcript_144824/m.464194 type:complete len:317 (+) Transcript_144824:69-1019(+)